MCSKGYVIRDVLNLSREGTLLWKNLLLREGGQHVKYYNNVLLRSLVVTLMSLFRRVTNLKVIRIPEECTFMKNADWPASYMKCQSIF